MRAISVKLPRELEAVHLYTFSDWHIGDAHCNLQNIQAQIKEVQEDELAYFVCNGDLINNATKASPSDVFGEQLTPQQQIELLTKLLMPIKDKCIFLAQGNHEARTYKQDGIDLMAIVASNIGCLDKYAAEGGVLFLRFGENRKVGHKEFSDKTKYRMVPYSFYISHGTGGGRKEGGKLNRLADLASIVDTDIYIMGHTHLPLIMKEAYYRTDFQNSTISKVDKLFVNTSAQLEYGGYGQTFEFKPSSTHNPIIYLDGKKKYFYAKL